MKTPERSEIDRLAEATWSAFKPEHDGRTWADIPIHVRGFHSDIVRGVLYALREPTNDMISIYMGGMAMAGKMGVQPIDAMKIGHKAMIDLLLVEDGKMTDLPPKGST